MAIMIQQMMILDDYFTLKLCSLGDNLFIYSINFKQSHMSHSQQFSLLYYFCHCSKKMSRSYSLTLFQQTVIVIVIILYIITMTKEGKIVVGF